VIDVVEKLVLSREAWERVVDHARAAYPDEAVGMLGGTADGRVAYVVPLPNLAAGGAFLADPRAQFEAERTFAKLEVMALGAYHSHPGGTPTLSRSDRVLAHPSLIQLVVGLGRGGRVDMRAYRVAGGVSEVPLEISRGTRTER
jgi:[CysO sulfur-carrier protein]-S-L-cysteine hydrolase